MKLRLYVWAILFLAGFSATWGARASELELVGTWPGHLRDGISSFVQRGNYIYAATGRAGLTVFDVTDPAAPKRAGGVMMIPEVGADPGYISAASVVVSGNYAYVVGYGTGLQVIDVSDPVTPVALSRHNELASRRGLAISGDFLYALEWDVGKLQVFSLATPTAPNRIASYDTAGSPEEVAVVGKYAYVADGNAGDGLIILDVSDPSRPVRVGRCDTGFYATSLAISGSYAYVIDSFTGLHIVDISNPTRPVRVGGNREIGSGSINVFGNVVYISGFHAGIVEIIDVSNPAAPVRIASYETGSRNSSARGVSVSGKYAYTADSSTGLHVLDVTDPAAPTQVSRFNVGGVACAVAVAGNYAYLADYHAGMQVIDITNPANPIRVGNYLPPGGIHARDVSISGGYAFIADAAYPGLKIVDVRNPVVPLEVGSHQANGGTSGVAVSGEYAYLGTYDVPVLFGAIMGEGVVVIDVSTPSLPIRVSNYDMRAIGHALAASGDYVYSAHGIFTIVDVSDPLAPTLAGTWNVEACCDVAISGDHAFVLGGAKGLHIVDVRNPAIPSAVGNFDTPGFANGVALSGKYALVADGEAGLQVIDVSNVGAPKLIGSYDTMDYAFGVTVSGEYIYVADQRGGLAIFRFAAELPRIQVERVDDSIVFYWPLSEEGYVLESAIALSAEASWSEVQSVEAVGDRFTATVNTSAVRGFYRLRKQQ